MAAFNRVAIGLAGAAFALASISSAIAQEVRLVLKGYDPVAYFTEGRALAGDPKYTVDWDEGRYQFSSAKHRDMFAANPDKYAPQFGGYCTGSMARGVRNEGHPEAWIISNEKLYVFGAPNAQEALEQREKALEDPAFMSQRIPKAQQNWRGKT